MRCKSGRWTVLIAVAVAVSIPMMTGCKSGTNLVSLPKMPPINPLSWGKKEAADAELAKREAEQLPRPSSAALAGPNAAALRPGGPAYPDTGRLPHQPMGGGYQANNYTYPRSGGSGLGPAPGGYGDPMSPAYARSDPRAGGQSAGFYDTSPTGYQRTASREGQPGGSPGGYDYPQPSRSYPDAYGTGYGDQYRDSRATPGRSFGSSPGEYGPNTAMASRAGATGPSDAGSYVRPAYDSSSSRGSSTVPASGSSSYPAGGGAKCSGDACSVPYSGATPAAGSSSDPNYRPFGTGNLDRSQWLPSKAGPAPSSTGRAPAPLGGDTMAKSGYDSYRPPSYPPTTGGQGLQSAAPPRDSAWGY